MSRSSSNIPVIIFGSSGFVGRSLVEQSERRTYETFRKGESWELLDHDYKSPIKKAFIIIAAGSSRFSTKNSTDFDYEIVFNISKFLKKQKIEAEKIVYISTLAANVESRKNNYGASKRLAENFLLKNFSNVVVWRPPALFGQGMHPQSHLNWFLNKRQFFYVFSKLSNSGISFLHVDDFSSEVHRELSSKKQKNEIIYPPSFAITFKGLAEVLVEKHFKHEQRLNLSKTHKIWSLLPFKLQPFFKPIWVDYANHDESNYELHLSKITNHVLRYKGKPTKSAPVVIIGAFGGLGISVCRLLEEKGIHFIAVDKNFSNEFIKWRSAQDYWKIDLTNDKNLTELYEKLGKIHDVSWIISVAGVGLRNELNEVSRFERSTFWKLMVFSRLDLTAWAQTRSLRQERIGIIHVSSSTSYFPLPKYVDYSIANTSIRLIGKVGDYSFPKLTLKTVVPGGMKTNLMIKYGDIEKFHAGSMKPERVSKEILRMILKRTKKEVEVGFNARILRIFHMNPFEGVIQMLLNRLSERLR
jgi:short-subunit dehydrogenase/nucleoside-diphosphate-sugar epimerase